LDPVALAFALLVVVGFASILSGLGVPNRASRVLDESRATLQVVRSPNLTDLEKETALQGKSVTLFSHLLGILFGSLVALAIPVGIVWLAGLVGLVTFADVMDILQRWDFLAAVAVLGLLAYAVVRSRR
jgi:hypothetical protein